MKCRWCSNEIKDGEECSRCWELRTRIRRDPDLAEKFLERVKADNFINLMIKALVREMLRNPLMNQVLTKDKEPQKEQKKG